MAGTRTTPPPMPRRPTSTPAPSPRRRMMNVIVIGWLCAYRLDDSNQISSIFHLPACRRQPELTNGNARRCTAFFVCAEPAIFTCLCHVGPAACWRLCGRSQESIPKKANPLALTGPESDKKEECDGTHANRTETRIFQRRAAKSRHHWLRLRWLAAGT